MLFFSVTIITFVIFFIVPADPARLVAGRGAGPADIARAEHFLGLDRPVYEQYGMFVWRLGHGSLGQSFVNQRDVNDIVL